MSDSAAVGAKRPLRLAIGAAALCLCIGYGCFFAWVDPSVELLRSLWHFLPIGIFGAAVANSTGTGGGVVFVPAFNALSDLEARDAVTGVMAGFVLSPQETVALSFAIQVFGMSVGSLSWIYRFYASSTPPTEPGLPPRRFLGLVARVLAGCLPALFAVQLGVEIDGRSLLAGFKVFSLLMGLALFRFSLANPDRGRHRLAPAPLDRVALVLVGAVGGVATAFFSVGVGEFLLVYLVLRGFPTFAAVAAAVVVSALTVIPGVVFHLANTPTHWEIALLAIPGAMTGGFLARFLAAKLGARRLEITAALWIVASSAYLIAML